MGTQGEQGGQGGQGGQGDTGGDATSTDERRRELAELLGSLTGGAKPG